MGKLANLKYLYIPYSEPASFNVNFYDQENFKSNTLLRLNCKWTCWRGEFVLECPSSETQSISVTMEHWSVEYPDFGVETYFKNNDSVVVTQRIFRRHFIIHWNGSVPSRNTVLLWVKNFRAVASKRKGNLQEGSLHLEPLRTKRGNGSHCEDCNANLKPDVPQFA